MYNIQDVKLNDLVIIANIYEERRYLTDQEQVEVKEA